MEVEESMGRAVAGRTYDQAEIIPLIAKGWELSDDRKELTIHLRNGLKWSDGTPLTTADVQFWYEDVFLNQDLTPTIDQKWMPADKVMGLVVDDETTFPPAVRAALPRHPGIPLRPEPVAAQGLPVTVAHQVQSTGR